MSISDVFTLGHNPIEFARLLWPDVTFYDKQRQVIESVRDNSETVVPAGNELGKDFVSGFICVWYFLVNHPVRIVTTSVNDDHLRVLWGEIGRFIDTAAVPLRSIDGGPLICNHREIKKVIESERDSFSYMIGKVSEKGEGLQGHHADNTLFVIDEASGVDDVAYKMGSTWADKILIIGNPWPCENFFKKAVIGQIGTKDRGGDIWNEDEKRFYRKVIQIGAKDSPNVKFAEREIAAGKKPSNERILPGVKTWSDYKRNLALWDPLQIYVSLGGKFYEGDEIKLIPNEWLNIAAQRAKDESFKKAERSLGIDTAEGGDNTVYTIMDRYHVIDMISHKTPDTSVIITYALGLMRDHQVKPENVLLDRGGGGKQHADRMRSGGYRVGTVSFGEAASDPKKHARGMKTREFRQDVDEIRQTYLNRRAEMYGMLREALRPDSLEPLAISERILDKPRADGKATLRGQLTTIPLLYDAEGKLFLPPKKVLESGSKKVSLIAMIGCSPDEADSLVVANFALRRKRFVAVAG